MPPRKRIKTANPRDDHDPGESEKGGAGDKGSAKGSFSAEGGDGDKESCAEKSKSRGVGCYQPDVEDEPISVFKCKEHIFEKFEKMSVLVENYKLHLGQNVYFAEESKVSTAMGLSQPVDSANYFRYAINNESQRRERNMKNLGTKASAAMEMIDELLAFLQYNTSKKKWAYNYDKAKEHDKKTRRKYNGDLKLLRSAFDYGALGYAFKRGMTNGPGKAALEALMNMAMMISLDQDEYLASFRCFSMGGGPDKGDKLPLKVTPPPSRSISREKLVQSPISDWVKSSTQYLAQELGTGSDAVKAGASSQASEARSQASEARSQASEARSNYWCIKFDHRGVYADVLACSGCEPNWPHLVFVGEVKCSGEEPRNFSQGAIDQLHREMMAVLLHQSLIYGILMSDTHGYLCKMSLDIDNRMIRVDGDTYQFVNLRTPEPSLQVDSLKNMFFDMIDAVDDIRNNVKEVCHFPKEDPQLHA